MKTAIATLAAMLLTALPASAGKYIEEDALLCLSMDYYRQAIRALREDDSNAFFWLLDESKTKCGLAQKRWPVTVLEEGQFYARIRVYGDKGAHEFWTMPHLVKDDAEPIEKPEPKVDL